MKKLAAVLTALVMALTAGIAAAEAEPFALNGIYTWGMPESEILATLGNVRVEKESERKLTYLDPEDEWLTFEGLSCEITFGLSADQLVLIELEFDERVASREVRDALTALYGDGTEVTDPAAFADLEALSDPDEIELVDDDPQTWAQWTAPDRTRILMITDTEEGEAKVVFYTVPEA